MSASRDAGWRGWRSWRQGVIGGFVLLNIIAISSWAIPISMPLITHLRHSLRPYMILAGLHQSWDMFAPEPLSLNSYIEADITYWDGRTSVWRFPRPQDFGYYQRYLKERYRKWANDHLRVDRDSALWPDAARFVARANNDGTDPPLTVKLVRFWSPIPPPESRQTRVWHRYVFFTYCVMPRDLR